MKAQYYNKKNLNSIHNLTTQFKKIKSLHGKYRSDIGGHLFVIRKERTHISGLAKVAVQYSADSFLVNQTLVLRINICGESRRLRQAANH